MDGGSPLTGANGGTKVGFSNARRFCITWTRLALSGYAAFTAGRTWAAPEKTRKAYETARLEDEKAATRKRACRIRD